MVKARTLLLAVVLCAFTATPAQAAFFPDLTVSVFPATAGSSPALTATISQPWTDTAIKRFTLTLPAGFKPAGAPGAAECTLAAIGANSCGTGTLIGSFDGKVGARAPFAGTIHKTGSNRFGLLVSFLGGTVSQVVEGTLTQRAGGALDLKFDHLPALPISTLTLRFGGERRSLITAPEACGTYTIDGKFTSRLDELAIDRTRLPVEGCHGVPAVQVANVRLSETRFEAGGSIYGTRTIIAWWASKAVDHTNVRVERRVDGAWRVVGVLVATGNQGDNRLRWDGRLKGRKLKPGRYGLRVQPDGSEPAKLVRFRIVD